LCSNLTIRRTFWLADVALVVFITLLAAQIVVAMTALPPQPWRRSISGGGTVEPTTVAAAMKPASHYAGMSKRRLFGGAGAGGTRAGGQNNAGQSLDQLKQTGLSLQLWGTAVGTEGMSTALIENTANKSQKVYREGDKVAQGAVLEQILAKRVVLNTGGKRELLTLAEAKAKPPPRGGGKPLPRSRMNRASRDSAPGRAPDSATVMNRKEWENKDPSELIGDAKVTPVYKDGRPDGLEVRNIGDNEFAKRVGLEEGDVIASVNGVKIQSLDEAYKLAGKLQNAPTLRVEILRDGRPRTLTFRVR
jgi:type II secretion system protein C